MNRLAAIALLAFATSVCAQGSFWKDSAGKPVPDSPSRKSKDDFGGWVLATPDEDWKAKWDTPSATVPHFNEAKAVPRGKRVFILVFFANPKADASEAADVVCDLKVTGPNRSVAVDRKGLACFKGRLAGGPQLVRLAAPVIAFVGEPADPSGEWVVEVGLRDNARGTQLPLRTSFVLQ